MWWYGRGNSGGSWLPEEKKANLWPGRGNSGGSWPSAFPHSLNKTQFCNSKLKIVKFSFKLIIFYMISKPYRTIQDYTNVILRIVLIVR